MKKGEKVIWGVAGVVTICALYTGYVVYRSPAKLMPTYQVESVEASRGELVYRKNSCPSCHRIWRLGGTKGGALDGIGSRRSAAWLTKYLSTDNPQAILPSTVKPFYQMPSFQDLEAGQRADLVAFLMSLKEREELEAPSP
ncbi:MAG: c-type cytochrome [Leptospirillia bacterium]